MNQDPIVFKIVDSKIRPELIISIIAIVVSIAAAAGTIYHGHKARKHLRLSVRPNLVYHTNTNIDEKQPGIFLENSGLGPAKIVYLKVFLDNKQERNFGDLIKKLNLRDKNIWGENEPQWTEFSAGTFIKEGKRVPLFCINKQQITDFEKYKQLILRRLNIKIKYCSMYDECWEESHKIN